jgi:hydrogenase/urease accessory protein HupE
MRVRALSLAVPAFMLGGAPAEAHLVTTGLGPVYDGISHFLGSPEDLVPVVALALLAGQCGLFMLPAAWLAGALAGLAAAATPPPDPSWLVFVLLGGLVAAYLRPPQAVVTAIACGLGFFNGFIDGSGMSSPAASVLSLIGIAATVFVVTALPAAVVVAFTWPPAKIAFRVLGSWTTATGMLMLGWSLR